MGVDDALRERGCKNGDTVKILKGEFEFVEQEITTVDKEKFYYIIREDVLPEAVKKTLAMKKALEEDSDEVLLELSAYLEGIGFYPQAAQIYEKLAPKFPEVYINLAAIAGEDGLIEEALTIQRRLVQKANGTYQLLP